MADSMVTAEQHLSPNSVIEKYTLDGSDTLIRFLTGTNVHLSLADSESKQHRERDSARVHTKVISEYKGDVRALTGRFVAAQGDLIAFRFHNENTGEVVRVINRASRLRHLIRGFKKSPIDIQYALHAPLLAVVDTDCNLYVYEITDNGENARTYLFVSDWPKSMQDDEGVPRIVWCPYVPEDPTDADDTCHMIAVFKGSEVHILNLSNIEDSCTQTEISFENAKKVADSVYSLNMDDKVTTVCISPDSTAVAVATIAGIVSFYITNDSQLKFAHNWNPQMQLPIAELFFLDDTKNLKNQEPFWRHCLAIEEGGRRMALFECEGWRCLGRLAIDCTLEAAPFVVQVDPFAKYAYVLDKDGANIFCIELRQPQAQPKFASVTQIAFCHPILSFVPIDVGEAENGDLDQSLDDEADAHKSEVTVAIVAMGTKSLLQLDVHLEKSTEEDATAGKRGEEDEETGGSQSGSGAGDADDVESQPRSSLRQQSYNSAYDMPSTSTQLLSVMNRASTSGGEGTSYVGNVDRELFDVRMQEMKERIEQLSLRVERADNERRAAATNEHILQLLQSFKEEFSLREDRLLANVSDLIETSRSETLNVVRNALNENSVAVENSIQANHQQSAEAISKRVADQMGLALKTAIVPSIEKICAQMFKQINDTFRLGLDQYMQQLRALQTATLAAVAVTATPAPSISVASDRQTLAQMIKNKQIPLAFETALNQGEQASLEFVCNNVDPDALFTYENVLSQPVLISLLQQLSIRLESDTDLKFRYIEHILSNLKPYDDEICIMVPKVLDMLNKNLQDLQTITTNPAVRRQARVICQLIKTIGSH